MKNILSFIESSLKEVSPWENINSLNKNIKGDILAGITVGIIALPLALAFGEISQLGPVAGIWGAIAGGIIGGLFGGCLVGVSGPTAPKAAQIAAFMSYFVIGTTNEPDITAAFSIIFLSGIILVVISLFKVSRFIHYTPYPVIAGFMCGIGAIVSITQINSFLGLQPEKNIQEVFVNWRYSFENFNINALSVSIPSLAILFLWDKITEKIKYLSNIPAPLISLVIGTGIAYFMELDIPYIGDKINVTSNDKLFSIYIPELSRISEFISPALALAGLAVLDSLLSCKVADNMTGIRHSSDRETFGQGMANMTAGLIGGVTTATATMRTVANIKFGAKTPLASIVHGITLLSILLGLGSLVSIIPAACLAAILFKVGIEILDYRIMPVLKRLPFNDLMVFSIVFFITIYADLMIAISLGVVIACLRSFKELKSIFQLKYKHRSITLLKSDLIPESWSENKINKFPISIFQPQGPLFFGSIESLISSYESIRNHKSLIIDMSLVTMIDLTGAYALEDLIKTSKKNNIEVFVSNAHPKIKKNLNNLDFIKNIGKNSYIDSKDYALSAISISYKKSKTIMF